METPYLSLKLSKFSTAQECTQSPPDPPNNGKVLVLNSGIKFGEECLGSNGVEALPGTGCNGPQIIWKSRENESNADLGPHWVTSYDILVDVPQTLTNVEALLIFSHDVNLTTIEISGKVRKKAIAFIHQCSKLYLPLSFISLQQRHLSFQPSPTVCSSRQP